MRTGVIAKKMGMTRLFQDDGRHVPVTVLALEGSAGRRAPRTRIATAMSPSSSAPARPRRRTSPSRSAAISARPKSSPRRCVAEFRVAEDALLDVGAEISADHFVAGQMVDIPGHTQGKGFAGRHEALGLRRSARHPRRLGLAPFARFDRSAPGSGQGLQEQEDGRPHGRPVSAPSRTSKSSAPTSSAA